MHADSDESPVGMLMSELMADAPYEAPEVAVYTPPNSSPWDDAVTLALEYARIPYERIWDLEVLSEGLARFDWLCLDRCGRSFVVDRDCDGDEVVDASSSWEAAPYIRSKFTGDGAAAVL